VLLPEDEILDPGHPWVANAEHAYFGALSDAGRVSEAVAFVNSRLDHAREFEPAAPWLIVAAKTLTAAVSDRECDGIRRLYQRIDDLVTSSPAEAWTGAFVGRSIRRLGAALGLADDDGKGLLIYVWILIVVSAVRAGMVSESEARKHLATLELRVGQLMGVPAPLPRDGRIEEAWRLFTREEWPAEARLLLKLATAILNLGSLHFRAGQFSEAFDAYREGLERHYIDPVTADRFGQALENAMRAGLEAKRYAETGRLMELLARRSGMSPSAINLSGMASLALLRGGLPQDALATFTNALTVHGTMDAREAEKWVETGTEMATMLHGGLEAPQKVLLANSLLALESQAETAGWGAALSVQPAWAQLVCGLKTDAERHSL
jgi:tetratricopeptide (TPR) repeat protein